MSRHLVEVDRFAVARINGEVELVHVMYRFSPIGGSPANGSGLCVRVHAEAGAYDTCICDKQIEEWQ